MAITPTFDAAGRGCLGRFSPQVVSMKEFLNEDRTHQTRSCDVRSICGSKSGERSFFWGRDRVPHNLCDMSRVRSCPYRDCAHRLSSVDAVEPSQIAWTVGRLEILTARHKLLQEGGWTRAGQRHDQSVHTLTSIHVRRSRLTSPWLKGSAAIAAGVMILVLIG
jgi:hypothetical protein